MSEFVMITAHSGCEGAEQDSMASVQNGIRYGADVVEVDVRCGKDSSLVISHNHRESYADCILLSEVFEAALKGEVRVNCDIKEPEIVSDVLRLSEQAQFNNTMLILSGSVLPELLRSDPTVAHHAAIHLNIEELLKDFIREKKWEDKIEQMPPWEAVKEFQNELSPFLGGLIRDSFSLGIQAINLPYSSWAREFFSSVYTMGVPISVWTVNDEPDMEYLIANGVLNLTTLKVRQAKGIRKQLLGY